MRIINIPTNKQQQKKAAVKGQVKLLESGKSVTGDFDCEEFPSIYTITNHGFYIINLRQDIISIKDLN